MDWNVVWFILLAVLFIGYVILDGFDLGVGMNHLTTKSDRDRRIFLNSIGPVWDANEVWLITAGGALFAAFPHVYATVFSGFYIAFMLFLLVIIGRAISIEFRSKVDSDTWKRTWDVVFCVSSYLIVILLGVTLGNIVSGLPIGSDREYMGTFFTLLNPYSIFVGLTSVIILKLHGNFYVLSKIEGKLKEIVESKLKILWVLSIIFYGVLFGWTLIGKQEILGNYNSNGALFIIPILPFLLFGLIMILMNSKKYYLSFLLSSLNLAVLIIQSAVSMYPNLVPSYQNLDYALSVYNSSSSESTLYTMFIIACIGIPLVLIYKIIVYSAFRGKVKIDSTSY